MRKEKKRQEFWHFGLSSCSLVGLDFCLPCCCKEVKLQAGDGQPPPAVEINRIQLKAEWHSQRYTEKADHGWRGIEDGVEDRPCRLRTKQNVIVEYQKMSRGGIETWFWLENPNRRMLSIAKKKKKNQQSWLVKMSRLMWKRNMGRGLLNKFTQIESLKLRVLSALT